MGNSVKNQETGAALLEVLMAVAVLAVAGMVSLNLSGMSGRVLEKAEREWEILRLAEGYMEQAKAAPLADGEERYREGKYEIAVEQRWGETRKIPEFSSLYAEGHLVFSSLDLERGGEEEQELFLDLKSDGNRIEAGITMSGGEQVIRTSTASENNALYCFLPETESYERITIDSSRLEREGYEPMPVFLIGQETEIIQTGASGEVEIIPDVDEQRMVTYREEAGIRLLTVTIWEGDRKVYELHSSSRRKEEGQWRTGKQDLSYYP